MAIVRGWPPQVPLVPPDEETGPPVESTADPQPEEPVSSASSISAGSSCEPTLVSVSQEPPVQAPDEAPEPSNPADVATVEDEENGRAVESADLQSEEPEPQYCGSSRSPYQRLAPSLDEFKELQAKVSALKEPPPTPDWELEFKELRADVSALKNPPPPDWEYGCMVQETESALTKSVYFISLLRVVSLLKRPSSEAPRRRRISRYLAAGGWMTIFVITAASQFFLMVLILETSTSNTCDVEYQTGCSSGEYCSFSINCKRTVQRLQRGTAGNEYMLPDSEHHVPGRTVCVRLHVHPHVPAFTDMQGRMPACLRHVRALHLRDCLW